MNTEFLNWMFTGGSKSLSSFIVLNHWWNGKDYIYACNTVLWRCFNGWDHSTQTDGLVQWYSMYLGSYGFGCEDRWNFVELCMAQCLETLPHVIFRQLWEPKGLRVAIGPCRMSQYLFTGLFSSPESQMYWKNTTLVPRMLSTFPRIYNDDKNTYSLWTWTFIILFILRVCVQLLHTLKHCFDWVM